MRKIKIKYNDIGRYDDISPLLITDGKLELMVDFPDYSGDFYLVTANNDVTTKTLLVKGESVVLDNLTAGELNAEVKHYLKGNLVKSYKVESLLLKEVSAGLVADPEVQAIKLKIDSLEKQLSDMAKEIDSYKAILGKSLANIDALTTFAFKDYSDNVYLNGSADVEEFVAEFGFDLDEEEITKLKENVNE